MFSILIRHIFVFEGCVIGQYIPKKTLVFNAFLFTGNVYIAFSTVSMVQ
jgi:hypothetical protein